MYNMLMIFTILSRMGFDLDKIAIKVQGDDSIVLLLYMFILICTTILQMISHYAQLYFGATLSTTKSEVLPTLEGAEVLKYRNKATMPYRDELTLLAMLRHPERTVTWESLMARAIGIAYADCGVHPRVFQICENIYDFLKANDITPDAHGLPEGLRYRQDYIPGHETIPLDRFPTWFDTVRHLQDPSRVLLTEKHWPLKHFIGIPGES